VERIYIGMRARKFTKDDSHKLYLTTEYFGLFELQFSLLSNAPIPVSWPMSVKISGPPDAAPVQ